jgi:hypothetical protein
MAIFGIGAFFDEDVSQDFIGRGVACVGWTRTEAPSLHKLLRHIKIGDLIYIKSYTPRGGLTIKAIGVVIDDEIQNDNELGVRWVWIGQDRIGLINDKMTMRSNTLYEEYCPDIQARIIELLFHEN